MSSAQQVRGQARESGEDRNSLARTKDHTRIGLALVTWQFVPARDHGDGENLIRILMRRAHPV